MKINKKQIKVMERTKKKQDQPMEIKILQEKLNQVKEFCYLTNDGRTDSDIK